MSDSRHLPKDNFDRFELEVMQQRWAGDGSGENAFHNKSDQWFKEEPYLRELAGRIRNRLADAGVTFESPSGEAMRSAVAPVALWIDQAAENTRRQAQKLKDQGDALGRAQLEIPKEVIHVPENTMVGDAQDLLSFVFGKSDNTIALEKKEQQKQQVVQAFDRYHQASQGAVNDSPSFSPPPPVGHESVAVNSPERESIASVMAASDSSYSGVSGGNSGSSRGDSGSGGQGNEGTSDQNGSVPGGNTFGGTVPGENVTPGPTDPAQVAPAAPPAAAPPVGAPAPGHGPGMTPVGGFFGGAPGQGSTLKPGSGSGQGGSSRSPAPHGSAGNPTRGGVSGVGGGQPGPSAAGQAASSSPASTRPAGSPLFPPPAGARPPGESEENSSSERSWLLPEDQDGFQREKCAPAVFEPDKCPPDERG